MAGNSTQENRDLVRSIGEVISFEEEGYAKDPVWVGVAEVDQFLQFVRSESSNEFCYLWLIFSIRCLSTLGFDVFQEMVLKFKEAGPKPLGRAIQEGLLTVASIASHRAGAGVQQLEPLGKGCFRYSLIDTLPVMHISVTSIFGCDCRKHVCEHGWDFISIMCILHNPTIRMGASTVDFNFLMGDDDGEDAVESTIHPGWPHQNREPLTSLDSQVPEALRTRSAPSHGIQPIASVTCPSIEKIRSDLKSLGLLPERFELREKSSAHESAEDRMRQSNLSTRFESPARSGETESLAPSESSSNVGRYKKTFLRHGEQFVPETRSGWDPLEDLVEEPTDLGLVAQGRSPFQILGSEGVMSASYATKKDLELEKKIRDSMKPVLGLAKPFSCKRLNFLSNLYTGMSKLYFSDDRSFLDALWECMASEPRNPVEELLRVVLLSTFNKSSQLVIANVFKLPYLEVGMEISEDTVAKCFDLLGSEYKICWFDAMKGIKVPEFHSNFRRYSTASRSSGSSTRSTASSSRRSSKTSTKSKSSSGSLLGMLMSPGGG